MPDTSWPESVETSPLLAVCGIGQTAEADDVVVEFLSLELREAGAFVNLKVSDLRLRDDGDGPLNVGMPTLVVGGTKAAPEAFPVMAEYDDANRVRYRIAIRPTPPNGAVLHMRVEGFESGMLSGLLGPWTSGPFEVLHSRQDR